MNYKITQRTSLILGMSPCPTRVGVKLTHVFTFNSFIFLNYHWYRHIGIGVVSVSASVLLHSKFNEVELNLQPYYLRFLFPIFSSFHSNMNFIDLSQISAKLNLGSCKKKR